MKLALIFDKARPDTIGVYFERACQTLGLTYTHVWTSQAQSLQPGQHDLYLRIDHGDYQHDLPPGLRPAIFLATDTHLPKSWRRIRRVAPRYDLVCCVHRSGARALPNGAWVPAACDPELHGKQALAKAVDVAFIGTEGGVPRKFYLQALRERYPNSVIRHAPHTELGRLYSQARIGFNYSIRDDVNMRMFEIMASGALLVTNRLRHDELAQLGLRDGEHLVCYDRPAHLFELIDTHLKHDGAREAIARRGMEHVLQHHTYVHRLQQILSLAEQRLGISVGGAHSAGRASRSASAVWLRHSSRLSKFSFGKFGIRLDWNGLPSASATGRRAGFATPRISDFAPAFNQQNLLSGARGSAKPLVSGDDWRDGRKRTWNERGITT